MTLDCQRLWEYTKNLIFSIPLEVYKDFLSVFFLGAVLLISWKGFKTGLRYSSILLLIEYIFLLYCSTVIFRKTGEVRQYDFHPFWSYDRPDLLAENIMNVVVFVPVGMILGSLLRVKGSFSRAALFVKARQARAHEFRMTLWKALLIGCSISISIEALQFCLIRGFSEIDDVMHNTLGCVIGYMLVKGARFMVNGFCFGKRLKIE